MKEGCPVCGSKKIIINQDKEKVCKICKHNWKYKLKKKIMKVGRIKFR